MQKILVILGPTASGKTDLAVKIGDMINTEIVSADSRQIYKHIPIASSVPSVNDRKKIVHHFVEEYELESDFNAGEFGKKGRIIIKDILLRNKLPLVVGGSGLYIRSLIDGFFEDEIYDKSIREKLHSELKDNSKTYLYNKLIEVDPESAMKMDETKYRRVIRALEVFYSTGKKISEMQLKNVTSDFEAIQVGLLLKRDFLYERINQRVEKMISAGLLEEVKKLANNGYHYKTNNSLNTVGIKEVFQFFDNEISYNEMVELIKRNTRNYAKRQMTWFRKDDRIKWIEISENIDLNIISEQLLKENYNFLKPYLRKSEKIK